MEGAPAAEGGDQSISSSNILGSIISLVTNAQVRYQGILTEVNPIEKSMTLENVKSHGSEGRRQGVNEIAANDAELKIVKFKVEQIKDFKVIGKPQTFEDPAIISKEESKEEKEEEPIEATAKPTQKSSEAEEGFQVTGARGYGQHHGSRDNAPRGFYQASSDKHGEPELEELEPTSNYRGRGRGRGRGRYHQDDRGYQRRDYQQQDYHHHHNQRDYHHQRDYQQRDYNNRGGDYQRDYHRQDRPHHHHQEGAGGGHQSTWRSNWKAGEQKARPNQQLKDELGGDFDFEKCKIDEAPKKEEPITSQPAEGAEEEQKEHHVNSAAGFFDEISNSTQTTGADRGEDNRRKDVETFGTSANNFQYEKFGRGRGGRGRGRGRGRGNYNNRGGSGYRGRGGYEGHRGGYEGGSGYSNYRRRDDYQQHNQHD